MEFFGPDASYYLGVLLKFKTKSLNTGFFSESAVFLVFFSCLFHKPRAPVWEFY